MSRFRRALALLIALAHGSAAALPCAPSLQPSSAGAIGDHHGGHHAEHEAPTSDLVMKAPCPCGCESAPAGAGPTARLGAALPSEAEPLPPSTRFAISTATAAPEYSGPDPRRDLVPI